MPLTDKQKEYADRWYGGDFKIGKQYYKSGWLEKEPENFMGRKQKRWFQFRHWVLYYFAEEQDGWNTPQRNNDPEDNEEERSLLDKFPGLPSLNLPSLSLPSLSLPDMPSISMPSIDMPSMPSVSAPSLSAPDLKNLKMPKKKERYENGPYGRINVWGGNVSVKLDGKKLTISNANQIKIYKGETEEKKGRTFVLHAPDKEEAQSWYDSLVYGGMKGE